MNKTAPQAVALARELVETLRAKPRCEVAVCPPFTAIESVAAIVRPAGIHVGAQDVHWEPHGAFTGEISAAMLAALGCRFVIIGHSERRHGMNEDDAAVARKLAAAQREGLVPIVCVGETLAERDAGRTTEVLVRQVQAAYADRDRAAAEATVVAYEPVWAIGTGRVATPDQAREAHLTIRATLDRVVAAGTGREVAILYGGSVNAGNAAELFAEAEVDGALVGGASLEAASFWKIAVAAAAA
jgi:triosephosphate isomerase